MNDGYIKLHRKFLEWEWHSCPNDVALFLHLLINANWKDTRYKGIDVPRGSLVTGRKILSEEVGLTEQQVRTSLEHLKSTSSITIKTYSKFSIISINNYDKYQLDNQQVNQQVTSNQPASNQQVTTSKEYKNIKNKKENISKDISKKKAYGQFENVYLTDDEYQKLKERFKDYDDKIENLSGYLASKGDKYKSHYATILNWARKDDKGLPEWFDKKVDERKLTYEEQRQLDELNRGY